MSGNKKYYGGQEVIETEPLSHYVNEYVYLASHIGREVTIGKVKFLRETAQAYHYIEPMRNVANYEYSSTGKYDAMHPSPRRALKMLERKILNSYQGHEEERQRKLDQMNALLAQFESDASVVKREGRRCYVVYNNTLKFPTDETYVMGNDVDKSLGEKRIAVIINEDMIIEKTTSSENIFYDQSSAAEKILANINNEISRLMDEIKITEKVIKGFKMRKKSFKSLVAEKEGKIDE